MYNYSRIFVGIPLSQSSTGSQTALVKFLSSLASEQYSLQEIANIAKEENSQIKLFGQWLEKNLTKIEALDIAVKHDYHGGDDYPEIFGVYVDELFSTPEFGAEKADFSGINKIQELLDKFNTLLSTLDPSLLKPLQDEGAIGIWFNSHSS